MSDPKTVLIVEDEKNIVDILRFNLNRKADNVRVFELGRVFFPDETVGDSETTVKGVRQPLHVAGLVYGDAHEDCWAEAKRPVDFFDVKGDVENLVAPLKATFEAATHPAMHPGRCARVIVNGKAVGFVGELHPKVCRVYELPKPPVVFELEVAPLCELDVPSARAVSKFQPVHRDISVTVPNDVTCAQLQDAVARIRRTKPEAMIIESLDLFDVYLRTAHRYKLQLIQRLAVSRAANLIESVLEEYALAVILLNKLAGSLALAEAGYGIPSCRLVISLLNCLFEFLTAYRNGNDSLILFVLLKRTHISFLQKVIEIVFTKWSI